MTKLWSTFVLCTASVSFVAAGSGIGYFATAAFQGNNKTSSSSHEPPKPVELTSKDKFVNNLLGSSSIKLKKANVNISGLDDGTLTIKSDDLALNLLESDSEYKGSKNMMSGNFDVSYKGIDESFGLYVSGDKATVNYANNLYSIDYKTLTDAISILKEFPIPTVDGSSLTLPSMDEISEWGQNALGGITEEEGSNNTYVYTMDLDPFGKIQFIADKDTLTLKGINTPSTLNLPINDKIIHIGVSADAEQDLKNSQTENVPNKDINDLNGLTGILKTVKDIYNSKSFDSTISAKLSGGDLSKDIDASIRLSGNFNADPYTAQVETISSNMLKGKALVTYSNGRTYVSVNDKIKGYIDNTTIDGLMNVFKKETDTQQLVDGLDSLGGFIQGTDLEKIINGDYSVYKNFLKSFNVLNNGSQYVLKISNKALGLDSNDSSFTLILNLNEDKTGIESLSVKEFPVMGYILDADIKLDTTTAEKMVPVEESEYGNYNGVLPIVNQMYSLIGNKKATFEYDLSVSDKSLNNPLYLFGKLSGDLTNFNSTDELVNTPIALTANASIDGKKHSIEARRLNNVSYVSFDNIFQEKATDESAVNIYKAVMDNMNKIQPNKNVTDGLNEKVEKVMDTVSNTIKGIFSFDNGLDLDKITEIFAIDSVDTSDTKINISFDTSKLGYDIGNIKVTVDVANDAIDVAVTGLTFNDTTISLNLKTIDYIDPSESLDSKFDPESYIQVNEFHNFINGLFDMITSKEQKYGVSLNATLASTAENGYTSHLIGNEYLNFTDGSYKGNLIYDMDDSTYDPYIEFSYNDEALKGTDNEGKLFASYGHKLTSFDDNEAYTPIKDDKNPETLYIGMDNSKLDDVISTITGMDENNLLYEYFQKISTGMSSIPLQDIIKNKDYTQLLNDFIRKIVLTDTEVSVQINPYYIGLSDDTNAESMTVVAYYSGTKITGLKIENAELGNNILNMDIDLIDYDPASANLIDFTSHLKESSYIDFNNLPLMLELGLNTTEGDRDINGNLSKTYTLSGSLDLDASITKVKDDVLVSVHIGAYNKGDPVSVSAYIRIDPDYKKGEYTEYYVRPENEDCLIVKHEIVKDKKNKQRIQQRMLLVTSEELTAHIGYYLIGLGMNFEDEESNLGALALHTYVVDQIEKAMSSSSSSDSSTDTEEKEKTGFMGTGLYLEKLIKGMTYAPSKDAGYSSGTFNLNLDLSSIDLGTTLVTLGNKINISVSHGINENTGKNELKHASINGEVAKLAGLFKINIDFEVDQIAATDYYWANYSNTWNQYVSNGGKDNDYYELETCKQTTYWSLGVKSKIEVTYKDSKTPIIVK